MAKPMLGRQKRNFLDIVNRY